MDKYVRYWKTSENQMKKKTVIKQNRIFQNFLCFKGKQKGMQ